MSKRVHIFTSVIILSLLVLGWDFHPKTSATVPGTNTLLSVNSAGSQQGPGQGNGVSTSSDGRYVAFTSGATNLVASDTNGVPDVFVRDTVNDTTTRISVASGGTQANDYSQAAYITGNGRYVLFVSPATNLADISSIAHYYNGLYLHDMQTGTTQLLVAGYYYGSPDWRDNTISIDSGQVSEDGNIVAYSENNSAHGEDAFVFNRLTNSTTQINVTSSGGAATTYSASQIGSMSCDGRFIVMDSNANNLVSGQTNGQWNAFIVDAMNNFAKKNIAPTANDNMGVSPHGMSCDGNKVVVSSSASNLVSGDTNNQEDVFLYDTIANTYTLESLTTSGGQGNLDSDYASISDNGQYISFESSATNLTSGDTNSADDIFLRDTVSGTTQVISRNASGTIGDGGSYSPQIERDGKRVVYTSTSTNLVSSDTNGSADMFSSATE